MAINGLTRQVASFDSLLRNPGSIYVENNTEPRGLLLCTINNPVSGKPEKLEFPRTWIPMCLTDMLPREVLERSLELRKMFNKGLLKYIPEEEALKTLNSPEGRQEYDRLMQSEFSKDSRMTERKRGMIDQLAHQQHELTSAGANPNVQYDEANLHPKVKAWETRVIVGELDGAAMMSELRIHASEFSKSDFEFMLAAQFPQEVKDYASTALAAGNVKTESVLKKVEAKVAETTYEADWQ